MKKHFTAPWSIKDLALIFAMSIILISTATALAFYFRIDLGYEASSFKSVYLLILYFIQTMLLIGPLIVYTHFKYGIKPSEFGFEKIGIWKTIISALSGYLFYLLIASLIVIFILYSGIKIPGFQIPDEILPFFGPDLLSLIIAGVIVIFIAPVIEEIFFRGFLLRTLGNKVGLILGSILSAGIFALFHFQFQNIIPIFLLGLILNFLVIRHKSIYPAIAFHVLNNIIAFAVEILI